jgi:type VI secretion system protein
MLNTRQGHTLTLPEYGMPDITSFRHALPEAVSAMENDIKNSIDKYEPRLRNVSVSQVPLPDGEMILRFEVTGELVTAREEASVLFETSINPSGYIEIKG